jgi:enterochelin esterase family protein
MKKETCDMKTQNSRTFGIWLNGYNGRGLTGMNVSRTVWKLWTFLVVVLSLVFSPGASGTEYRLGVDSLPQEGVPKGTVEKHTFNDSKIFPGTTRDYWVYVPAQYDASKPACVMVFLDGGDYVMLKGEVRVPTVFDNLIHKGEMPVTIGIFVNPGKKGDGEFGNRDVEYVTMSDTNARFLLEEIIPAVGKDYNLVDNAEGRAICGMSDGGVGSFTVAWERPDAFSKCISHIGSYVRIPGGAEYPYLVRKTRGNPKPLRVFLQDGSNDLDSNLGSWTLGNINMAAALKFARYDYRFEMGTGGHSLGQGGALFPDTLRWIWRDYPGVKGADDAPDFDAVVGQWDVVTNVMGWESHSVLSISEENGALTAELNDEKGNEYKITAISFKDGILRYEYGTGRSIWEMMAEEEQSKEKDEKEEWSKSKESEEKDWKEEEGKKEWAKSEESEDKE